MNLFRLFRKEPEEKYTGDVVDLIAEKKYPGGNDGAGETIYYGIYVHDTNTRVGYIDLRLGMNRELYYAGNVGYHIHPIFRGHHYAYEACLVVFRIARDVYKVRELIITCSPENTPSRKTLERLQGELLETVDVPSDHWLYQRGETVKNIYKYTL